MNYKIEINTQSSIKLIGNKTIYFDPYKILNKMSDADLIFITHNHYDHYDIMSLKNIINNNTKLIVPNNMVNQVIQDNIIDENKIITVLPNNIYNIDDIAIKTIPSYNVKTSYHQKNNNWVGYIITIDNISYYIAGDTDITEENKSVKANIIFIPIGGTYTMDIHDAYKLTKCINPDRVIPTHYGSIVGNISDGFKFKEFVKDEYKSELYIK